MTQEGMFIPASLILQELRDQAPTGPVTLQWLMGRLRQQSFGMIVLILAIVATAPGISVLAGLLLLVAAFQMMLGLPELRFPGWMATRELPRRPIDAVVRRAIPILVFLERAIYPRLATPPEITRRLVGAVIFILTVRLLLAPLPLSNVLPAILIAFISLTYLEHDGLLLIVGLLVGCLFLIVEFGAIWHLILDAKWIEGIVYTFVR
jgi:hypothetical protein